MAMMYLYRLYRILHAPIARSWWLSRIWYRLCGTRLEGRPDDHVWYFAYGANMHEGVFRRRRGIEPIEWRPGRLPGYHLRFNMEGYPKGRAAPANVERAPSAEVWGVLYRITRRDLVWLDHTEAVPVWHYKHLWAAAEDRDGNRVEPVVTYSARGGDREGRPSLRYITLLREGARAHGLPEHWVRYLDSVEPAP
ncbi:gamma-glutamylcyclotransferase family protein [Aquisalimonas sp.]|uniref:gamma-glutamylcyclotransferase family protein n=1 Tax=Aquisalimonas sp. TaxID=1872621 RepID=UPI0025BEF212|nr:gamma-glutamylcyclotransferase family protein [Aquisalimonas sp.]